MVRPRSRLGSPGLLRPQHHSASSFVRGVPKPQAPRTPARPAHSNDGAVYFEFVTVGRYLKVSAIDAVTGEEVSVMASAKILRHDVQQVALRKLRYVQRKKRER